MVFAAASVGALAFALLFFHRVTPSAAPKNAAAKKPASPKNKEQERDWDAEFDTMAGNFTRRMIALDVKLGWQNNPSDIQTVIDVITNRLSRSLIMLSSDEWWTALEPYLRAYLPDTTTPDPALVCTALEQMVANLDNIEHAKHPRDVTRTIAAALLWLARADFSRCIDLLLSWLNDSADGHELRPLMGSAGAQLLFNVYAYAESPLPLDPYDKFFALLQRFAENLSRDVSEGVMRTSLDAVWRALTAIRRWIRHDEWYARVFHVPEDGENPIDALLDQARLRYAPTLTRLFDELNKPIRHEGEEKVSDNVRQWVTHLRLRLALGSEEMLPELADGQRYGIIAIDAGRNTEGTRQFFAQVTSQLLSKVQDQAHANAACKIVPLVYRIGQTQPIAIGIDAKLKEEFVLPTTLIPRPALLGSLLCRGDLVGKVGFVMLIINHNVIDAADWIEMWQDRTLIYSAYATPPAWMQPFKTIARQETVNVVVQRTLEQLRALVESAPRGRAPSPS
jgi:hypothetical protein